MRLHSAFAPVCLILFLQLAVGCATVSTVENEPLSAGATHSFNSDYGKVVAAARLAVTDVGLSLKSEKPSGGGTMLLAQRGVTAWSWGEVVRLLILPHGQGAIVRITTERAEALNVTAKDFTEDLFTRIGQQLGEYP